MTTVFAILRPRPERADELERDLLALARSTAAEPGARAYSISRTDDHQFLVFERYVDPAARDAHFVTPHLMALLARFPEVLASEPQVVFGAELEGSWTGPGPGDGPVPARPTRPGEGPVPAGPTRPGETDPSRRET